VSVLLGLRIAVAGGRESVARMMLIAVGVAVGVTMLLASLTLLPAMQDRVDRLAWHRTTAASPPTAPDRAIWLPFTDRYAGQEVVRIQVAALGPRPPVPPGMDRLPGPGEVFVSPELAMLLRTVPADQLGNRFPGRVTATIREEGLASPVELVAVVGRTPDELRGAIGAFEIRGIEQPGDRLDLAVFLQIGILFSTVLLVGPVVVFVMMVTRVGAARREQRFAAIRLAGATRWQTGVLAATETAAGAVTGTLLGFCGYQVARLFLADRLRFHADSGLGSGTPFFLAELAAPAWQLLLVLVGMPLVAVVTTLLALHRVQITPLGAGRRVRRKRPTAMRLAPLVAGIVALGYGAKRVADDPNAVDDRLVHVLNLLGPLSILVGLVLTGPWACMWISRGLARRSRNATTLIAARRIASDPYTTFRAVAGVAIAVFAATAQSTATADDDRIDPGEHVSVLNDGVVGIDALGASDAALAPLISEGVVVVRIGPAGHPVVRCADLARISTITCPLPASYGDNPPPVGLINVWPGFAERGPGDETLPIHSLYVPTDGTRAGEERVRTIVATLAPYASARTNDDWYRADPPTVAGLDTGLWLTMAFIVLVAACSLTVSVVAGLMDRKRPFALLRASGVRLGELRRIALLESGFPLVVTVLGAAAVGLLVSYVGDADGHWAMPAPGFFLGVGIAVLLALGVCMISWPLMNVSTRHDAIRYE
jgi:hypothetical protein